MSIARIVREAKRRVLRRFAGVEFVSTVRHEDGSATITFVTFDDNADDVLETVEDLLDGDEESQVRFLVLPHE